MLRSMILAAPVSVQSQHHATTAPAAEAEEEAETETETVQRLGRFTGSGPSLRDELAELVQEDPDAAANILRTWIGSPT